MNEEMLNCEDKKEVGSNCGCGMRERATWKGSVNFRYYKEKFITRTKGTGEVVEVK